jgi:hypothetical protein
MTCTSGGVATAGVSGRSALGDIARSRFWACSLAMPLAAINI